MMDERTLYSIIDEHGNKSTITLDKLIADALQESVPDVHGWVQSQYNRVVAKRPALGRIQKGDLVRLLAQREAENYPALLRLIEEWLGPSLVK